MKKGKKYAEVAKLVEPKKYSGSYPVNTVSTKTGTKTDICSWQNFLNWWGCFALDVDGEPVLVEFNMKPQGLDLHQRENGPIFGDITVEILDEVFGKNK